MVNYKVTVYNSERLAAYTRDYIYITLVGEKGQSKTTWVSGAKSFLGMELKVTITTEESLGKLQQVVVQKDKGLLFYLTPNDNWLPTNIEVITDTNETYIFPLYTWITDSKKHHFREGQAFIPSQDPFDPSSRREELDNRQEAYHWEISAKRIPDHIKAKYFWYLPLDAWFIFGKITGFATTGLMGKIWEHLKKPWFFSDKKWSGFDEIGGMMDYSKNKILDYVRKNWRDDDFFGYQCLNGLNPMVIKRCESLPDNFPVTDDMIIQHSNGPSWLDQEMQCGNIFLCDYKMLDKVEARKIDGKQQYLAAPLVLLHKKADDKLVPIAIQLKQEPGPDNPIFLPADQYDWLLAKIFVRSAEFNLHELNFHLLRTHLLAEVFALSTLRNLPMVHPLYKLLIPHTRYTLSINVLARTDLISKDGVLTNMSASGGEGMFKILEDSLSSMTYRSLCIPDDIADRGMENIPNFYYRDDGLKLWSSLHRFVAGILNIYYKTDEDVEEDPELQMWISEIFRRGFLSNKNSGIPNKFTTVADLVKFVTMVIFTGSVQHSAVNSGQYEFGGWMPNLPSTMEFPPPTEKGKVTSDATIMEALPNKTITLRGVNTLYLLTREFADFVPFGNYPEEHFTEEEPRRLIQAFQNELKQLSDEIKKRNEKVDVPYEYLDPEKMGNSVSI